jgi:SAM-dependent methyltransferase
VSTGLRHSGAESARSQASSTHMRRRMFLSQDGVVLCTTLCALDELGVLEPSLEGERSVGELCPDLTDTGFGALRVAVRTLASTGFLADPPTLDPESTLLRWTDAGAGAMTRRRDYVELGRFLARFESTENDAWTREWDRAAADDFARLVESASERRAARSDLPDELATLVETHLDAGLIVPTMLWLHQSDALGEDGPSLQDASPGAAMERLLLDLGWIDSQRAWTADGLQARSFALNFGGVATYLPLLARLPELYRGELTVRPEPGAEREWHVHRELNLRISSQAHSRYFADTDPIFLEIFNREPISDQPRFIADMGCGDGSWLLHLHKLVFESTRRGQALDSHPLALVGVDTEEAALEQARRQLEGAGVSAALIEGDVTDPDRLASDLADHGLRMEDGLHIRSFIDHERTYLGSGGGSEVPGWASGAYLDSGGGPLSGEDVERDLVAHLSRWARHVPRHGMVVLEAHSVAPRIAARQLGSLHSVAFDAHQAYSKQYPVDHPAWLRCAQLAGLRPLPDVESRYPSNRPFVAISLNRLLPDTPGSPLPATDGHAERHDTWRPGPGVDLADGRALHEMLFSSGDIRHPAIWHSAATGYVVGGALDAIDDRLGRAAAGDVIRVLDYGAGTGTASIELLKALRERGIERRLDSAGAELEMHLVDLPSGWYAQAYELLGDCSWTRFHSLRAEQGGFRPLLEATEGREMDVVMASMVFHLIPNRALEAAAGELASVLVPGGRLVWSSPDLGPPGLYAVLLHDPNRALRERAIAKLAGEGLDPDDARIAQERAERRILPRPLAGDVAAALERHFDGEIELRTYEMTAEEIVRGLLVPSNQAEYLPEIADLERREGTIRELMLDEIIPEMQRGRAGTALGLNLHWTLGSHTKRA